MPSNPKPQPIAFITLRMRYPAGDDGPLPREVLDYHEQIEDEFDELEKLSEVDFSVSSASSFEHEGQQWWWEDFTVAILEDPAIERIADRLVQFVRGAGIRFGHSFWLDMQILLPTGERNVYTKRIYPKRETKWSLYQPPTSLAARSNSPTEFPRNLGYLAEMAQRCYGLGGDDIYGLFPKQSDLTKCIKGLSDSDRKQLAEIYLKIVRLKHNEWFLQWMREHENEEESPRWVDELYWFLAVLDRLREGGLLAGARGKATKTVLKYWDDYLCGDPRLDATPTLDLDLT
ncbi:MAG: hypothetical protein KDB14_20795 [Planctomycetales bacterium]|nr:hypothetical protein [Planctomycetales bacterium]